MHAPEVNWQHFVTGLRGEAEDRLSRFARTSPMRALAASAGAGFLLGLMLPPQFRIMSMAPIINSAVERWMEGYAPNIRAAVSELIAALREQSTHEPTAKD